MSNPIVGQSGVDGGAGAVTAKTQRAVLATDQTAIPVTASAGTNLNTSALALEAGGNLAAAAASLSVMDDWDESDRAKVNPIVGQAGIAGGTGVDGATVPRVSLATNVALPAGTNAIGKLSANSGVDIGDVDVTSAVITGGGVAHDGVATGVNPLSVGGYASAAAPTDVSSDGDSVRAWHLRNGALATVLTAAGALVGGDAANGLDVDVTRLPTLANVTTLGTITNVVHVDDNSGNLSIDDGGNSITVDYATTGSGTATGALRVELPTNGTGVLATVGAVTAITNALPAGTNAIGKLSANSGVDIGDVDVTSAVITGGAIAHDAADSGNGIKVAAKAVATTSTQTLVSANDRTDVYADLDGTQLARNQVPLGDLLSERVSDTGGTSTAFATFDNAAGKRNYITSVTVHNAHASTNGYVDLRDGTAGAILWTFPLPATGGATHNFNPPLRQPTAATALAYDVSAAITTVYISINGFKSKL